MNHTIRATASDIRSALGDRIRKDHPDLCRNKVLNIKLEGEGNDIVATVTFENIRGSDRD